ncbi:hemolysin family protein [Paenibacillus eucommiae]|uniref:CBS domain containing-hemolysin-like protein n=1 Tax=Paenibacillus eucommiae TaxID=1355755 RepID=A0ABS4J7U0_9BACL|nr:hemolysin family protein [Paenibacillus eucommiae]MBP1995898.1 CBS domain containing-hemolysin-like protein [Paenibacillus eucommiae]
MHTTFEWDQIIINTLLVLFLVLLNGFFVAAEFSLVKVRQSRIQQLVNEGSGKAKFALTVTKKLDTYLSATQLGITLASLGLGWVGEPAISTLIVEPIFHSLHIESTVFTHSLAFIISFAVITFLHIVLGELAPKSFAIQKPEVASLWLSAPLLFFYRLFKPIIWVLNAAANTFLRWIGVEPASEHEAAHTEEELRILMDESVRGGHINKDEMQLFDNIFEFSDRIAREVMLPRTDMDCLFLDLSFAENLQMVYETKHTRYPVGVEDKDQIIGFVHIADLLTADPDEEQNLQTFIRPILNVPESMEISLVLKQMQKKHSQLAIVVDEYGGTAGMVTLGEILEEIVGELHDEFDQNERSSIEKKEDYYSVDGRMLIEELNDMLGLGIEDDDVDSIGGWLFKKLEGPPLKGKKVTYEDHLFEITEIDRLRVLRVHIKKIAREQTGE